jgi:hypothetical protein
MTSIAASITRPSSAIPQPPRNASTRSSKAVDVLTHGPLIGRKVKGAKRELVIGRASREYVVLCRFLPDLDTVFVLALRSQRESDYRRGT